MTPEPVDGAADIEKLVQNILIGSGAQGKFPTPVDKIVAYTELSVASGIDLSQIEPALLEKTKGFLGKISRKVLGIFDFRERTIYLDDSLKPSRKNFVKLHEVGHGVIPCQRDLLGFMDDEETISADIKEGFERQASYFASAALFQLERFDEEAMKLPLALPSARALGQKFGGSVQASLRRYVEKSTKRCALLVLHPAEIQGDAISAKVRNFFASQSFQATFGLTEWPKICGLEFPFVRDIERKRRDHQEGTITLPNGNGGAFDLEYHFFNSSHNYFVFFIPPGERIASAVKVRTRKKEYVW